MKAKPYPGFFLTVEGGEGCGKSTLSSRLMNALSEKGLAVVHTREPGGTPLSETLRDLVLSPDHALPICERAEMMLFLTARVQHLHDLIMPALHAGKIVICDRFNDSTIAYQACARHLGTEDVEQICALVCDRVTPDCTLLLDLDPEVGLSRVQNPDRLEQEKLQFHRDVRQGYLRLHDKYPERIHLLDAAQSADALFEEAFRIVERCCAQAS